MLRTFAARRHTPCSLASASKLSVGLPKTSRLAFGVNRGFRTHHPVLEPIKPFLLTDIGEGIAEVEVLKVAVKEGDTINEFDPVCEVQSDKATVEITSRFSGTVKKVHYNVGDIAIVGKPLIDIDTPDADAEDIPAPDTPTENTQSKATPQPEAVPSSTPAVTVETSGKVLATPAVRRIARENNVDLARVPATGKGGRVLKGDILRFLKEGPTEVSSQPDTLQSRPQSEAAAEDQVVPVRGLMRTMIKTMTAATAVPHFGLDEEVEMDRLMEVRTGLKGMAQERSVKLTFMPFFIKAASLALKQYPILNSQLSNDQQTVVYKGAHNIGVAMDTPSGLIVPNIKDVQRLSIMEVAGELNRLQQLGKEGKLGTQDLTGGTFTISNIGVIGGTYARPVVNLPEVCIGAVGSIRKMPRFAEDGSVVPRSIMCVSWSADHRIIDGATMGRFSNAFKRYLEDPNSMLVDMK